MFCEPPPPLLMCQLLGNSVRVQLPAQGHCVIISTQRERAPQVPHCHSYRRKAISFTGCTLYSTYIHIPSMWTKVTEILLLQFNLWGKILPVPRTLRTAQIIQINPRKPSRQELVVHSSPWKRAEWLIEPKMIRVKKNFRPSRPPGGSKTLSSAF